MVAFVTKKNQEEAFSLALIECFIVPPEPFTWMLTIPKNSLESFKVFRRLCLKHIILKPTAIPKNAHILKLTLLQVSLPLFESAPGGRCAPPLPCTLLWSVDIPACIVDFIFVLPSCVRLTDYSASTFRWIPNLKTAPGRWRVRHTTNLNNLNSVNWVETRFSGILCVCLWLWLINVLSLRKLRIIGL